MPDNEAQINCLPKSVQWKLGWYRIKRFYEDVTINPQPCLEIKIALWAKTDEEDGKCIGVTRGCVNSIRIWPLY